MIEVVMGKGVGAGKSFYVLHRIIAKLMEGGTVCAADTYGLKWEEVKKYCAGLKDGRILEDGQYSTFAEADIKRLHEVTPIGTEECTVLVVVDEAHGELNARDWADKDKKAFFKWLTQSRHDDTDVIFLSQHMHNLDKQILRLATYVIRLRNMKYWGIMGIGMWPWKEFHAYRMDGMSENLIAKETYKYDFALFNCYVSKAMRGRHQRSGVVATRRVLKSSREKKPIMKPVFVIVLLSVLVACICGARIWSEKASARKEREAKSHVVAATPAPLVLGRPAVIEQTVRPTSPRGGAWDVVSEVFRATDGRTYLHTDVAQYDVGTMSPAGFVESVSDHVAKVRERDGRTLYVVAQDKRREVTLEPEPVRPVYKAGEMSARYDPPKSAFSDKEQARIQAELARPIGAKTGRN